MNIELPEPSKLKTRTKIFIIGAAQLLIGSFLLGGWQGIGFALIPIGFLTMCCSFATEDSVGDAIDAMDKEKP